MRGNVLRAEKGVLSPSAHNTTKIDARTHYSIFPKSATILDYPFYICYHALTKIDAEITKIDLLSI